MTAVELQYGEAKTRLRFPEDSQVAVCEPARAAMLPDPVGAIRQALRQPIGSPGLREIARGKSSAAVAISDFSRATPDDLLLPLILDELNSAGIPDRNVAVIVGAALHRHMSESEVRRKVGEATYKRVKVKQHDPDHNLVHVGTSRFGNEIWINREMVQADVRISTGDIVPHPYAGYSAGGKAVLPGLAGRATILRNHLYVRQGLFMGKLDANPVREEINEAARLVGLHFIVNTVMDSSGKLVKVVAGDPIAAHREGAKASEHIYKTAIPFVGDLFVLSAYPYDSDFYYGSKPLENVGPLVPNGASVLLLSPCRGGWGSPDLKHFLSMKRASDILDSIEKNPKRNLVTAIIAYQLARLREKCHVTLYAEGLPRGDVEKMQMRRTDDPQRSIDEALATRPSRARVVVMPRASLSMPVLEPSA